jgi:hypothetical protein
MHFWRIVNSDYYLHHAHPSAWDNSAPTRWIFMKFEVWRFSKKKCTENSICIKISQE